MSTAHFVNAIASPYSASRVRPATIVGSANGRSMSALTIRLPRKSSRTSTHAMIVPITALIAATSRLMSSVKRSAATDWRLETESQNATARPRASGRRRRPAAAARSG
jgi:hypothetical protein